MTDEEIRKIAQGHWGFIKTLLLFMDFNEAVRELTGYLYIESFVHGAKHEREGKQAEK